MTNETGAPGVWVDTVSGPTFLPDGVPEWVTQSIIEQAGGLSPEAIAASPDLAPAGPVSGPPEPEQVGPLSGVEGLWMDTVSGPAWIPYGVPPWVAVSIIDQAGGLVEAIPRGPVAAPSVGFPAVGPAPSGGATAPAGLSGLPRIAQDVVTTARGLLAGAGAIVGSVSGDVKDAAGRLLDKTRGIIDQLVPTISELAIGLTSKFADLAEFIGGNLADVGDFAGALAGGIAGGFSEVLSDAWTWLVSALASFFELLNAPARNLYNSLVSDVEAWAATQ